MSRAVETDFTDITISSNSEHENSGGRGEPNCDRVNYRELGLCVSSNQMMQDVLQLATARLCAPGDRSGRRLRREGDLLPLAPEALVGEALRTGDRLILEVATGTDRIGSGQKSVEDDGFGAATLHEADEAISPDSAAFLRGATSTQGE
jgi:hypothetical protein